MMLQELIAQKIQTLTPSYCKIDNESAMHRHSNRKDSHFKVLIVSECFVDLMPVKRHQLVYALLAEEFLHGLHALALHLYTPQEWEAREKKIPSSSFCHKHD